MDFNNKVIILRDKAGLTQEEVAEGLNISKSSYSRKENGITQFTFEEFRKLSDILGFTVTDFRDLKFPIIHEVKISPELLDELERSLCDNNQISPEWNINKDRYNRIQKALKPVLDEKMHSFDFPDINMNNIPQGTTIKEVRLDIRAEKLINEALEAQNRLAHAIFGAES